MTDIKSTAVVKYSATKAPEPYCELELNTNLNSPPEKWLQGRLGEKEPFVPGRSSTMAGKELNSFMMANNFLDYVGGVDAITDAENVKRLLKMPYSKSCVSMMVHRIGKTLLIDQFDIYRHVLMAQQQEWKWLREFIIDTLMESGASQALIPAHAKGFGRKDIQEKLMLSKFLYYSLANGQLANADNNSGVDVTPKPESSLVPDPLRSEFQDGAGLSQEGNLHERNLLWRLEDIRMLVGNDMPIFGAGTHPCVSLRLRDMKKPINVLTGIDYWLDQLMCNVPEVVMCYHLNGIVQKYEVVKTEDLPNLPDCKFNPEIVRDVAQNILSFLKSNAAKEGHTYWLFKGHGDDVVKLYDLTSICKEYMTDNDVNPFTLPVAVLMYRVARNLLQKMHTATATRAAATVYRLLNHCLELIDRNKSPQVAGSVHYLLATLYITCGWPIMEDPEKKANVNKSDGSAVDRNDEFDDSFDVNDWFTFDDDPSPGNFLFAKQLDADQEEGNCSCVSLSVLTKMSQANGGEEQSATAGQASGIDAKRMPNCKNLEDCCKTALEHIYEGLECIESYADLCAQRISAEEEGNREAPLPQPADTTKPIPLRYEPLRRIESSAKLLPLAVRQPTAATSSFQPELSALLLVKAATAYYLLADCAFKLENYGKALRYVSLGLLCYDSLRNSFDDAETNVVGNRAAVAQAKRTADALVPSVLMLCGDVHISVCHQKPHLLRKDRRDLTVQVYRDDKIAEKARKALPEDCQSEYAWCTELPDSMEQNLILSSKCYDGAGKLIKEAVVSVGDSAGGSPKKTRKHMDGADGGEGLSNLIIDSVVVAKRQGNVKNELGLYYMNVALAIAGKEENPKANMERVEKYWRASYATFQEGISIFQCINDDANEALLNSNCARLMRACAQASGDDKEQFGAQERHYYHKAIEMYQRALDCVSRKSNSDANVSNSIAWDLSSTYFTYATQLQERPPLSSYSLEEVEREIVDYMHKALRLVENLERVNSSKHDVYLYRSSTIHHKLASLYYRLFVEKGAENEKKAKQQKALAELHYSKAADGFRELVADNPCEFIRVQLERVALLEYCIEGAGNTAKQKLSREALRLLFACQIGFISLCRKLSGRRLMVEQGNDVESSPVTGNINVTQLNSDGKDSPGQLAPEVDQALLKECQILCELTQQRLQAICKSVLKVCCSAGGSGKAGHNKEHEGVLSQWKRAYAVALKPKPEELVKLPGFILSMLQLMVKEIG